MTGRKANGHGRCGYAAEYKDLDEPLGLFVKRRGGINECAARLCPVTWADTDNAAFFGAALL